MFQNKKTKRNQCFCFLTLAARELRFVFLDPAVVLAGGTFLMLVCRLLLSFDANLVSRVPFSIFPVDCAFGKLFGIALHQTNERI
jgi:hypothetical protein